MDYPLHYPNVLLLAGIFDGDGCWALLVTVTEHLSDLFVGGKSSVGSQVQRHQPMPVGLHCLGSVVRQCIVETEAENVQNSWDECVF